MNGEYKEKLPYSEGELIVTNISYKIQFYFSGPDMRYNGTFVNIDKNMIDGYVDAFEENWQKYLNLKESKPPIENEFSTTGIMGMKINIGGYFDGVCIESYHMPIRTEASLKSLIDAFHWAKERGPKIMTFLNSL